MDLDRQPDAELLRLTRSNPLAFGVFYRRHGEAVLNFLVRRASSAEAGADLTAETFATALADAGRFDPRRGDAAGWLYGIAKHKLAAYHRSGAVERRAQRRLGMQRIALDDHELERVETLASLDVSAAVLSEALDGLPPAHRSAVVDRVVEQQSYAEIGAAHDITPGLARQRVARGLNALRDLIGGSR